MQKMTAKFNFTTKFCQEIWSLVFSRPRVVLRKYCVIVVDAVDITDVVDGTDVVDLTDVADGTDVVDVVIATAHVHSFRMSLLSSSLSMLNTGAKF
jgi:hypothetical protein